MTKIKANIYKICLLLIVTLLFSCDNSREKNIEVDYTNTTILDSVIRNMARSNDTVFLGFTIGMTETDYKNHIDRLRNDGKTVSYSHSNMFSTIAGTYDLGAGYTFKTRISTEIKDKTYVGKGEYFLEPVFNKNGRLIQLSILPNEEWKVGEISFVSPNWLKSKVKEKFLHRPQNKSLKRALIANEFIDGSDLIRQKGNLVVYETSVGIVYVDLKTLLLELLIKKTEKETEKETIKEKNKDIKF